MWLTNSFIIISLLFIWCWDYPADHPAKMFITKFSFPFVDMGFWHGWAMFAPEPIHVNRRLRAVLTFADGTKEDWSPLGPDSRSKLINLLYARSFKYEHSLLGPRVAGGAMHRDGSQFTFPEQIACLNPSFRFVAPFCLCSNALPRLHVVCGLSVAIQVPSPIRGFGGTPTITFRIPRVWSYVRRSMIRTLERCRYFSMMAFR